MSTNMTTSNGGKGQALAIPAHLQGMSFGVTDRLMAGIFTGGNRIGLKGSRFRLVVGGVEEAVIEQSYIDVVLLSAAPAVSRAFYEGAYKAGENKPPTCYSADGIAPPDDVKQKQSLKCATCPRNVKGSKIIDGNKYKECGYFRRVVVAVADDLNNLRPFKLDVKSQGLWGEPVGKSKNFVEYIKALSTRGIDAGMLVTRISFDPDSSTPKLVFAPQRFISADEAVFVQQMIGSDEVLSYAEVNMSTLDTSGEEPTGGDEEQEQAQEAAQTRPAQAATKPAQQAARPAQAQATRPAATQAAKPAAAKPAAKPAPVVEDVGMDLGSEDIIETSNNDELSDLLASLDG